MSHDQLSQPNSFPAKFLSNGNVAPRGNVTSLNIGHEGRRKIVSCLGNRSSQILSYTSEIFHSHLSIDSIIRELAVHR